MGTNEVESGFRVPGVCVCVLLFKDTEVPDISVAAKVLAVVSKPFQVENVLSIQPASLKPMHQLRFA